LAKLALLAKPSRAEQKFLLMKLLNAGLPQGMRPLIYFKISAVKTRNIDGIKSLGQEEVSFIASQKDLSNVCK
jgi:hypothetical protein